MKSESKGLLAGFVGVCAFGLTLPVTKFIIPYLDPIFIGLGRAVVAAVVSAFLLLWFRQSIPDIKQFFYLLIVAFGVVIGFPIFSTWAMQYVPASHGGVVVGVLPLATVVVGVFIGHERPSKGFWLVSIIGCLLVVGYALQQAAGDFHIADLALLGAVISAAIGYAVGGKLAKELGGWQVICWALVVSFPFIILPTIEHAPASLKNIPSSAYMSFIYLALVSQLFAFFAWYKGLALGGIARVSQMQLIQPFITILASVVLLNEIIDLKTIIFALLIVSTVWLGKRMPIFTKA